jgi:hypothetical protein
MLQIVALHIVASMIGNPELDLVQGGSGATSAPKWPGDPAAAHGHKTAQPAQVLGGIADRLNDDAAARVVAAKAAAHALARGFWISF